MKSDHATFRQLELLQKLLAVRRDKEYIPGLSTLMPVIFGSIRDQLLVKC